MALIKKMTLDNGVEVNYHKIQRVEYQYEVKQLVIEVVSYTDEDRRNIEKEMKRIYDRQIELQNEITLLLFEDEEKHQEVINEKQKELNELHWDYKVTFVTQELYAFQGVEPTLDLKKLYNLLKNETDDTFKDAKDM